MKRKEHLEQLHAESQRTATVYSAVSSDINGSRDGPELDVASQQTGISYADELSADWFDVDKSIKFVTLPGCDNLPNQKVPDEKSMPLLQPLLNDTVDLFADADTKDNCGIGVTSRIKVNNMPLLRIARSAASLPRMRNLIAMRTALWKKLLCHLLMC